MVGVVFRPLSVQLDSQTAQQQTAMEIENGKILIIDDDEDVLLAAKFILKKHFKKIIALDNTRNIEDLLSTEAVDVALLDMNYSAGRTDGKEGFDMLQLIKQKSPATRVIMMTAYGDIDLAIKAIKEGAYDFMVKPWDNAKLISTVLSAYKKGFTNTESPVPKASEENNGKYEYGFSEVMRVFMFLDIKSSTTIAENLGHIRYFELLNDFFRDIADPIEKNKGQIYQYVGDEVVVSWNLDVGIENNHCINCFFDIHETMCELNDYYQGKYKLAPEFKAGLHYGLVSTGTVGTLKKEVIYTGDVLNTASRIESLCNQYEVNLLLSEDLLTRLDVEDHYEAEKIGEINLRGRNANITLYTLEPKVNSLQKSI